jgi:hypothetical protein
MAESAAQRNARLRAARKAAMGRVDGGAKEDAAVSKAVASSPPPKDVERMNDGRSVQDAVHTEHHNRPPKPVKQLVPANTASQKAQPGSNKVYTKHVVFALVSAVVIQLIALNKSLPTKG